MKLTYYISRIDQAIQDDKEKVLADALFGGRHVTYGPSSVLWFIMNMTGAQQGALGLEIGDQLRYTDASEDLQQHVGLEIPRGSGVEWHVLSHWEPVLVREVQMVTDHFPGIHDDVRFVLAIPVMIGSIRSVVMLFYRNIKSMFAFGPEVLQTAGHVQRRTHPEGKFVNHSVPAHR